jgi:hypothetical protein
MVEQGTHKPLVVGSNPALATTYFSYDVPILMACSGGAGHFFYIVPSSAFMFVNNSARIFTI